MALVAPAYLLEVTRLKLVTFLLPEAYLEGLDRLVERGPYPSRSAAIRLAVRDLLRREVWQPERVAAKEVSTKRRRRGRRPPRPSL